MRIDSMQLASRWALVFFLAVTGLRAADLGEARLALELGEHGVRVNCICPGIIATPLAAGRPDTPQEKLDALAHGLRKAQALGRTGQPEDIARAALWLASDESGYTSGLTLTTDAGVTTGAPRPGEPGAFDEYAPFIREAGKRGL